MSKIFAKWFGGMIPRRGDQHLADDKISQTGIFRRAPQNPNLEINQGIHATEAENCNLYSGELRPLHKPALAHTFCRPTDECWRQPLPDDPSVPPDPPPEPPDCIPVSTGVPCQVYDCASYRDEILLQGDLLAYSITDEVFEGQEGQRVSFPDLSGNPDRVGTALYNSSAAGGNNDPFGGTIEDTCDGLPWVAANQNVFAFRMWNNGGTPVRVNDPAYATALDDATVHGIFNLPFDVVSQTFIGWYAISFTINIDFHIRPNNADPNADGFIQLSWIGNGGGASTRRWWTSPTIPGFRPQTNEPFWLGVNMRRTGNLTNADIGITLYFSDLKGDTPVFQELFTEEIGQLENGGIRKFAYCNEPGVDLTCGVQMAEGVVGGTNGHWVQMRHVAVKEGGLSAADLTGLSNAWAQNNSLYVDPNPDCGEIVVTDNGVTYPAEGGTELILTVTGIAADTTTPIQYQWYRNNIVMPGEVGPILTINLTQDDSYAFFSVTVQNPCGFVTPPAYYAGEVTEQPICKVYECDAFVGEATQQFTSFYKFNETDGTVPLTDENGIYNVPVSFNTVNVQTGEIGPLDSCSGDGVSSGFGAAPMGANAFYRGGSYPDAELKGSIGFMWGTSNDDDFNFFHLSLGPIDRKITLTQDGARRLQVNLQTAGGTGTSEILYFDNVLTVENDYTGDYIIVTYDLETAGDMHVEVWRDFVSLEKQLLTDQTPWDATYTSRIDIGSGGGNGGCYLKNLGVAPSILTAEQMQAMSDAWEQNKTTYVDPNPTCRPPDG